MNAGAEGPAALQAAIAAANAGTPPGMAGSKRPQAGLAREFNSLDAASLRLLWRVRATLAETIPAVVQFTPCRGVGWNGDASSQVALGFAHAAAALWGRTLLVLARNASSAAILPDAFVPGLYHQSLGGAALFNMLSGSRVAAGEGGGMFRVVVVDQAAPDGGDCGAVAAPLCGGTVVVVQAGRSDIGSIRAAISKVTTLGGVVLGTVLAGAPAWSRAP